MGREEKPILTFQTGVRRQQFASGWLIPEPKDPQLFVIRQLVARVQSHFRMLENPAPDTEDIVLYAFCKGLQHGVIQLVIRRVIRNQSAPFYPTNVSLQQTNPLSDCIFILFFFTAPRLNE
jgi:hypothetical protein